MEPTVEFVLDWISTNALNVKIMMALRDLLDERDQWSLIEEGDWEEFAKPTGAFYGDRQGTFDYIKGLESRVYDRLNLVCYANEDTGMYTVEEPRNED